ncbi:hypothetical protein NC653_021874 [Populus alba x Populus x berolinensis]|uniref:Vacuolar protein-sorting-associated protein 36 n=1 Tax=Populus alba x Populus x berolinensis TaxID=444605 RepID=A0AAD6QEE6_9ROSI|nr:hypothetical protein NC653_021874 [Populus alba x Populus x berolinensis]
MWQSTGKGMQEAFQDLNALLSKVKEMVMLAEKMRQKLLSGSSSQNFVRIPLEKAGGMINLIDIYCLLSRAPGTELISPEDLLQACSLWGKFDVYV